MNFLPKITPRNSNDRSAELERKLMRREARIGGSLFGALPKGHHRQFFCLDEHTWVWHETWTDQQGRQHNTTTRYEVRPDGVLKVQDGQVYQRLSRTEARNLYKAVKLYQQRVGAEYQRILQPAA
jgi:hypothetical protein